MIKKFTRFTVWSNIFYLVPLVVAWVSGLWFLAPALLLLFITSAGYHISDEKRFVKADQVAAYLVIFLNLYVLFLSGFPFWNVVLAVAFLGAALYFRYIGEKKNFELHHGLWHVSCALITLACVISYALPF